jgi:predicted acyltransferase
MALTTAPKPAVQSAPDSVSSSVSKPERLVSLDVFRGLTIALMILVNNAGSPAYWPLQHAAWNGWTLTDMVFPSFLFIMGVAMTFSFAARAQRKEPRGKLVLHLFRRAAILFFLGLVVNGFPHYHLQTFRILGVLQRIALCYLSAGLLYLWLAGKPVRTRVLTMASVAFVLIAGYAALLKLFPVPGFGSNRMDPMGNLGAYLDRIILTTKHMYTGGVAPPGYEGNGIVYDPEGLLSTLPAIANVLIGLLAGEWLRSPAPGAKKALKLAAAGVALFLLGYLFHPWMPFNKRIWTSTFVLLTTGFSLMVFSFCYWVVDLRRWRGWIVPALVFGTNAILAYTMSELLAPSLDLIHVGTSNLTVHGWALNHLFLSWLSPINASLGYAIGLVLLHLAIVAVFYRKRIFLRI